MNEHAGDCLVDGYQKLIPSLCLPDPNDHHVLAAAIHTSASIIVTYNLKDFPLSILNKYGIEAQHPDNFIINLMKHSPEIVSQKATVHQKSLRNPPKKVSEYLDVLNKQSLPKTVEKLGRIFDGI
jgi:hypothetical protein